MKNKFTILGCGSSLGSPWITDFWGNCKKNNKKNIRTRCAAHISYKGISILIDTSPDIKAQFKKNKIKSVDAIVYTHEHADQTSGIFELRPFFWKNKKKINVFGSKRTIKQLLNKYTYCFLPRFGYQPIMKAHTFKNRFRIYKKRNFMEMIGFDIKHGLINASGFLFNKIAYISDCNGIPKKSEIYLKNLDCLIVDCLRNKKHPSHFNFEDSLNLIKKFKPKKAILTNLHVDFDYDDLKKKLPKNIIPAYDGLSVSF